jgi:hypothetical protein
MGSPLTSAEFVRLMKKDLREVSDGEFKAMPSMIPTLYRTLDSQQASEEFYGVTGMPDIPAFNGKLSYLPSYPGFYTKIEPKEFAAGRVTERKFIDDNQYSVLTNNAKGLVQSMGRTREKYAARPFAYATSTAFDFMESEEGVALASDSHTTKSGTSTASGFDNLGSSALSKTSLAATWLAMRRFRDPISERFEMDDSYMVIVPDALGDTLEEIVKTPKSLDTAEGNINPQASRYSILRYLRLDDYDTDNWMMVNRTLMREALLWIDRVSSETNTMVDFETFQVKHSIYGRWGFGFKDWRWCFYHAV